MKPKILLLFLSALVAIYSSSQTIEVDGDVMHWEGGFNIGLNNDGYEMDFRGLYFPVQYFGLKIGVGFAGEMQSLADLMDDDWESGDFYTTRFKFNPAIVLRTPRLVYWRQQDGGFYVFAEPGIMLAPNAVGRKNSTVFSWDLKTGINFQIDRYIFTLGYGISNFSLYSGTSISYNGTLRDNDYITHSIYIGGAIKF